LTRIKAKLQKALQMKPKMRVSLDSIGGLYHPMRRFRPGQPPPTAFNDDIVQTIAPLGVIFFSSNAFERHLKGVS
jgi:hypothetical protein